jgi:hypothetical protein
VGRNPIRRFIAANASVAGGKDELDSKVGRTDQGPDSSGQGLVCSDLVG